MKVDFDEGVSKESGIQTTPGRSRVVQFLKPFSILNRNCVILLFVVLLSSTLDYYILLYVLTCVCFEEGFRIDRSVHMHQPKHAFSLPRGHFCKLVPSLSMVRVHSTSLSLLSSGFNSFELVSEINQLYVLYYLDFLSRF